MGLLWNIIRACIIAAVIVVVAELSKRSPRVAATVLALPAITILAFVMSWWQHHDLNVISIFAKETLVLVIMGLPLFLPLIYCNRWGLGFWGSMTCGIALAGLMIAAWLMFGT
jgi:hypothetical protein